MKLQCSGATETEESNQDREYGAFGNHRVVSELASEPSGLEVGGAGGVAGSGDGLSLGSSEASREGGGSSRRGAVS